MIRGFFAFWKALSWANKQRKGGEKFGVNYFSDARMHIWRLGLERIGRALEKGDLGNVPPIVKWFLGRTRIDNKIGHAIQVLLKSDKLATGDKALNHPYQTH
ncbi:hypothetical protein LCGC14_0376640 [marine sediment metagenome]|uniref:Uncharacterized protein n=1 Tax=marine sediment metagenome TaxID=412755 RepID=A0A0F9WC87_9ZZZZ